MDTYERIIFVLWLGTLIAYAMQENIGAILGFTSAIMYLMYKNHQTDKK